MKDYECTYSNGILYGYGIHLETLKISNFLKFLIAHKNTLCKRWDLCKQSDFIPFIESLTEYETYDALKLQELLQIHPNARLMFRTICLCDEDQVQQILADIITYENEHGIRINDAFDSGENVACLLFLERLPWQYTKQEQSITEQQLFDLFQIYANELELDMDSAIGYFAIERL